MKSKLLRGLCTGFQVLLPLSLSTPISSQTLTFLNGHLLLFLVNALHTLVPEARNTFAPYPVVRFCSLLLSSLSHLL